MKTTSLFLMLLFFSYCIQAQVAPNVYAGVQHNITDNGSHTGLGLAGETAISKHFSFILHTSLTTSSEDIAFGQIGIIKEKYNVFTALPSVKYYPSEVGRGFSTGIGFGYLHQKVKLKDIPDDVNVTGPLSASVSDFIFGLDLGYQYKINNSYAISLDSGVYSAGFGRDGNLELIPIFFGVRKTFF